MSGRGPLRKKQKEKPVDSNDQKAVQAERQKYREKVKKYTKYKIGRKIS